MFYVIALAGAHKRVVDQLREQLAMVSARPQNHCHTGAREPQYKAFCLALCSAGGEGQALPDPEAVPGAEDVRQVRWDTTSLGQGQPKSPRRPGLRRPRRGVSGAASGLRDARVTRAGCLHASSR